MFKLNDPLEDVIEFNNVEYQLDMAFDNVIDAIDLLDDKELTTEDKVDSLLEIMLDDSFEDFNIDDKKILVEKVTDAINLEPVENQRVDIGGNPMPKKKGDEHKKLVSFLYDAKYIFSAFKQAYGIDLIDEQGSLHWVKFSALMNALPDDTLMRQIIDIRNTNLKDVKDKSERQRIKELQSKFQLPDSEIEEEGGEEYGE